MKTIDDIYEDLRQWGFWQRTIERNGLSYTLTQFDANIVHSTGDIKPMYRDEKSEYLDRLIAAYMSREYKKILALSFVDQKSNVEAAIKMNLSKTTFKAKRREAMSILIGIYSVNSLDRSTAFN